MISNAVAIVVIAYLVLIIIVFHYPGMDRVSTCKWTISIPS